MIKFAAKTSNGPLFGFGLTQGNIDHLRAGEPIVVSLADLGGPDLHVLVMYGETEAALVAELKAHDLLDPNVEYKPAEPGMTEVIRVKRRRPKR
jgi:hypothetical protein